MLAEMLHCSFSPFVKTSGFSERGEVAQLIGAAAADGTELVTVPWRVECFEKDVNWNV